MKTRLLVTSCWVALCAAVSLRAEVKPNPLFSDHMVLQNGMSVPVWGTADAGEKVTVRFAGQTKIAIADADGKWMVKLAKLTANASKPITMTMTIAGRSGTPITINDVLVGEVWLVYGKKMEFSGPLYTGMKVEGGAMRISFTHAQGLTTHYPEGLYAHVSAPDATGKVAAEIPAANDGPLKWFQIAGADGKYVDAQATIKGSTVVVQSPDVTAPVSARYAWDNYPYGANLYNAAGLPAVPFRTNKMDDAAAVAAAHGSVEIK